MAKTDTLRWLSYGAAVLLAAALPGIAGTVPADAAVSRVPASGTPQLAPTGTTEQIRQLVQCGKTMYGVGTFTEISRNGTVNHRNNAFSFSATAPYTVKAWNPDVNGTVNTIAFNGSNCGTAYIGGKFTSVHGTAVANIAAVSTATGAVDTSFAHSANGQVETLASHDGHLLAGGYFTSINGSAADPYFTSLNPASGRNDGFADLHISGNYQYCNSKHRCASSNPTRVYNQQISHGGNYDLIEGDFTSVGGAGRQQIAMLSISGSKVSVTGWTSKAFYSHCWFTEPFYVRAASWSPNDATVYIGTTGFKPYNWNGHFPLTGLCDQAAAFPATHKSVSAIWHNYTGCDSLYSTAADRKTAYFGGHERWSQNSHGCNNAGPGAIPSPGMEGLSPATGKLIFHPGRSRGLGADDMLATKAGLWIASDNFEGSDSCGGVSGHAGLCFLPY